MTKLNSTSWSFNNVYLIDSSALLLEPGDYRVRTIARERQNKKEVLVKYRLFEILSLNLATCEQINGKTYTNLSSAPQSASMSYAQALGGGTSLSFENDGAQIQSISFANGVASVKVEDFTANINFVGSQTVTYPEPLLGTYTCNGANVDVATQGTANSSGALGINLELSSSANGTLALDSGTDTLSAGVTTFE